MLDSGETALQCQAGVVSGNVSIMTSCSGILQPAIRTFLTENREIHYQQYRYTSELIAAQLEGGTADFAVTTTPHFLHKILLDHPGGGGLFPLRYAPKNRL